MRKISLLVFLTMLILGCEKIILGEDAPDNPVNNFELLWQDFDEHYGLLEARGRNWDSIYQVYRPRVSNQTTDEELWNIFKEMIGYLDDSHTFVYNPLQNAYFASGSEEDSLVEAEFSIDLIKDNYLESYQNIPGTGTEEEDVYLYGKIRDRDIGYIYLNGIEANNPDFMDIVLAETGGYEAIILDVRNNFGGDDLTAEAIAGRFADGQHFLYTVQERNGPNHTDFAEKKAYYSQRTGKEHFSKPLIVLTDKVTVSAAEVLLLHLKSFEQVIQVGDSTAGDFSDTGMRRFLPNGWQYQYSIMMFLLPDGRSLDGIGHVPDVQIRNSVSNIESSTDMVFEKAVQYLFDTYQID